LRDFIRHLPADVRFALEFRDSHLAHAAHRASAGGTPHRLGLERHFSDRTR
jgi:hypothetical protein